MSGKTQYSMSYFQHKAAVWFCNNTCNVKRFSYRICKACIKQAIFCSRYFDLKTFCRRLYTEISKLNLPPSVIYEITFSQNVKIVLAKVWLCRYSMTKIKSMDFVIKALKQLISDSQPVWRGTQRCREELLWVPPNIEFTWFIA